jgi:hypothetical protein
MSTVAYSLESLIRLFAGVAYSLIRWTLIRWTLIRWTLIRWSLVAGRCSLSVVAIRCSLRLLFVEDRLAHRRNIE